MKGAEKKPETTRKCSQCGEKIEDARRCYSCGKILCEGCGEDDICDECRDLPENREDE